MVVHTPGTTTSTFGSEKSGSTRRRPSVRNGRGAPAMVDLRHPTLGRVVTHRKRVPSAVIVVRGAVGRVDRDVDEIAAGHEGQGVDPHLHLAGRLQLGYGNLGERGIRAVD